MPGRMSLGGEAAESPSEDSSSCFTEDKMLVLAGGPVGENPVRAFPDTGLLQGDGRFPAGLGYAPAPAGKRGPCCSGVCSHTAGVGGELRKPCPPVPTTGPLASECHPDGLQKDSGFGEAPGAECQVCDRQGQRQGPICPHTAAGTEGHREGGVSAPTSGRPRSWGDAQKQPERQNPV